MFLHLRENEHGTKHRTENRRVYLLMGKSGPKNRMLQLFSYFPFGGLGVALEMAYVRGRDI